MRSCFGFIASWNHNNREKTRINKYLGWQEPNKSKWLHWNVIFIPFTCGISLLFTVDSGGPWWRFGLWVLPLRSKYYCWWLHKWTGTGIHAEAGISRDFVACTRKQKLMLHQRNPVFVIYSVVKSLIVCCCCCFRLHSGTFLPMSHSYRLLIKRFLMTVINL